MIEISTVLAQPLATGTVAPVTGGQSADFAQTLADFLESAEPAAPPLPLLPGTPTVRQTVAADGKPVPQDDAGDENTLDQPVAWLTALVPLAIDAAPPPVPQPGASAPVTVTTTARPIPAAASPATAPLTTALPAAAPTVSQPQRDAVRATPPQPLTAPAAPAVSELPPGARSAAPLLANPLSTGPAPVSTAPSATYSTVPSDTPVEQPAIPTNPVGTVPSPVPAASVTTVARIAATESPASPVPTIRVATAGAADVAPDAAAQPARRAFAAAIATALRPRTDDDRNPIDSRSVSIGTDTAPTERATIQPTSDVRAPALNLRQEHGLQGVIDRIEILRDDANARDTRIRLVPDALGSVDIAVRKDGNVVHVHFTAENRASAALLAEAQPRLAELADARGVKLGQASVSTSDGQAFAQQQQQQRAASPPAAPPAAPTPADTDTNHPDHQIA